jgi:beta-1,4-mannosyl-glycoprotein beta-1,4-N-acetylglucosaminyltransferase
MILDCFTFFNELDLLEGRLEYLYDSVDYFILVESNLTHSGKSKPMYFIENIARYKKYQDKILYFPFVTTPEEYDFSRLPTWERDYESGSWKMENAQRNHITKALELFKDDAVVMISDLDEIPHKGCIDIAKNSFKTHWPILAIEQTLFSSNFTRKMIGTWHGTVITTNEYAQTVGAQGCREVKYSIPVINNGGWHLTFWGSVQDIQTKIDSFSHQELNTDFYKDPERLKEKIANGGCIFDKGTQFETVDINTIDQDIVRIFGNFNNKLLSSINV